MKRTLTYLAILALTVEGTSFAGRYPIAELSVPESGIIFAHANHKDLACTDCHDGIENSDKAADRNFPGMDFCGNCHDIEDDSNCGMCHRHPDEPQPIPNPERTIIFSHRAHLSRRVECSTCHDGIADSDKSSVAYMPSMATCLTCHDGARAEDRCETCHGSTITLADIHPAQWRHEHAEVAAIDRDWCMQCHQATNTCLECHRGDNLTGNVHDLNYIYTHGLDAQSKKIDCARCHDRRTFCNDCHERENVIPLLHSTMGWLIDHGRAARRDVESCASCHDSGDPTCARSGCHRDADGVLGTDPSFHSSSLTLFDSHGPWHSDDGYFCFQCHTSTHSPGQGFCGYCHR